MKERICGLCGKNFPVYPEDIDFYARLKVPPPSRCPTCRLTRRLLGRNTRNLYYRTCNLTGERILSQYAPDARFPVYGYESWWSDRWDGRTYGRDFDFEGGFFEQCAELKRAVPHLALFNTVGTMQNSEFNNCAAYLKNCYLVFETDYCEECYYGNLLKKCTRCVDCSICYECELCYECVDCMNCYRLKNSQDCHNCSESYFLKNCQSCSNCIGCINLRHREYVIFNEQYTKEEYETRRAEMQLETREGREKVRAKCREFFISEPHKNLYQERNENSLGDHLYNSKNAFMCFDSKELEDCRYCAKTAMGVKSSMDYNSWGDSAELMYESSACGDHTYNMKFCLMCIGGGDLQYCIECMFCRDCFGCVGLKRAQYCILNKQYSKEEYEELVPRIVESMGADYGEFFPEAIYAFAYNESLAMDCFPLSKEEAIARGYKWREEAALKRSGRSLLMEPPRDFLPSTADVPTCRECGKNYRLINQEVQFYRANSLPTPEKCPTCRHRARMKLRNPLMLWDRQCAKCGTSMKTSFSPTQEEIVYCTRCSLEVSY